MESRVFDAFRPLTKIANEELRPGRVAPDCLIGGNATGRWNRPIIRLAATPPGWIFPQAEPVPVSFSALALTLK